MGGVGFKRQLDPRRTCPWRIMVEEGFQLLTLRLGARHAEVPGDSTSPTRKPEEVKLRSFPKSSFNKLERKRTAPAILP
jgi:hypothetical protein